MARYSEVGVLPLRLTPTRMTSALARLRDDWPSSCASEKLIASMRSWYSSLLAASEKRPMRWFDLTPNSTSSGSTKVRNMSSTSPLQASVVSTRRISSLTSVMKTIGRRPSCSLAWLISSSTAMALSTESMNGRRTCRGRAGNCARIELPKVSAVMPVPSETKNTVRLGMRAPGAAA